MNDNRFFRVDIDKRFYVTGAKNAGEAIAKVCDHHFVKEPQETGTDISLQGRHVVRVKEIKQEDVLIELFGLREKAAVSRKMREAKGGKC